MTGPHEPSGPEPARPGSTIEPGDHVGLDRLADRDAGLLDAEQAASVDAHVAGCPVCRADQAALDALHQDLASLSDVDPMPQDLAARVDAALAGEAGAGRRTSAVTVVPTLEQRRAARSRRATKVLQVAAGLVVLLGLGTVGYLLVTADGGSSESSTVSAGAASGAQDNGAAAGDQGAPSVVRSGTDYRTDTLGQALGAVTGAVPKTAASPGLKAQSQSDGASPPSPEGALSARPGPGASTGAEALAGPRALTACLDRLGLTGTPLGVDLATFAGRPAAVIVLPTEGDPTHVDVYAVAPSCPAGALLAFQRVPRP